MSQKIRTRQVHKDIKVLDKTVTVTDHVKQSYVRTKENVMQSVENSKDRNDNPVSEAEDTASEYADRIFHGTESQIRRQIGKRNSYQPKEQIQPEPSSGKEMQEQAKEFAVQKIKKIERDNKTIKNKKSLEQAMKTTEKGTIKISGKSVKTAEQTAKTSIKTSDQVANASMRAMHHSIKNAEKAVQTARRTQNRNK